MNTPTTRNRSFRRLPSAFAAAVLAAAAPLTAQQSFTHIAPAEPIVLTTSLRETRVRPVLEPFEASTGYEVRVQRSSRPTTADAGEALTRFAEAHADVWWCQETLATDALKRAGGLAKLPMYPATAGRSAALLDPEGYWVGIAPRARILMVNTDLLPASARPHSMWDLITPAFAGKVAVASPTGGTARFHFLALQQALGAEATQRYLEGLTANRAVIARGDRQLAELIGDGVAAAGMTDTSDYLGVASQGKPVAMVFPDQDGCGTLLIPHTVALLTTSGNPAGGRKLIDYLLSAEAERELVALGRGQLPLHQEVAPPTGLPHATSLRTLDVDLAQAAALVDTLGEAVQRRFPTPAEPRDTRDFEDSPVGTAPAGMTIAQTRDAAMCVWSVTEDPSAPSGHKVLTQTDATETGGRYPMCIVDDFQASDVSVQVCFKTMTGEHDRAAGLCVRYLDADNYYCCRVNSLEDNYRFYKVVDGQRIEIGGKNHVPILEDLWQSMRIDAQGDLFRMWLNGALVFEARDATFPAAGQVGLWLKGDSITSFDDLTISPPPSRWATDFERDGAAGAPHGMRSVTSGDGIEWSVVDAGDGAEGRRAVTPLVHGVEPDRRASALLLAEAFEAADVSVATRFKVGTEGSGNHVASLVVRYLGPDDYHQVRFNPEECNIRLYRVRGGERQLVGEVHHTRHDEFVWHSAQLTAVGARFEVLVDGVLQLVCRDEQPAKAGLAGLWATPGDGTLYDEVRVEAFR